MSHAHVLLNILYRLEYTHGWRAQSKLINFLKDKAKERGLCVILLIPSCELSTMYIDIVLLGKENL